AGWRRCASAAARGSRWRSSACPEGGRCRSGRLPQPQQRSAALGCVAWRVPMGRLAAFLGMPLAACLAAGPLYAAEVAPQPSHFTAEARIAGQPNALGGLVAVLVNKAGTPVDQGRFDNPYVSGVALQVHWADIEPTDGVPDWTQLD